MPPDPYQREEPSDVTPAFPALTVTLGIICVAFAAVVTAMPIKFFAEDSYFYFQVAWNFARGVGSTFNGIVSTNGYHPLWMLCCAAVFKLGAWTHLMPGRSQALYGIAALLCLFDLAALVVLRALLRRLGVGLWPLAVLIYAPFCFLSQLGTEGALSGFLLATLMLTMCQAAAKPTTRRLALANTIAGLAVLARLDNIFIVVLIWVAVWLALRAHSRNARSRFTFCAAVPVAMWAFYIFTNHHYFGTIQPISGLLKSNSDLGHHFGANLPHTGELALLLIVLCLPVLALRSRDLFFKTIELPFALGVFCHAYYILFRMSSETRWSWYYTSWVLLAAVLVSRVASLLLASRRASWSSAVGWTAAVLLALVWVKLDFYGNIPLQVDEAYRTFQHEAYEVHGVRRLIAYDGPGRLAYFSDVQIVPLDGLMGDLAFQREIGSKGIGAFVREHNIDAFAGPPVPFDAGAAGAQCGKVNLSSTLPTCAQTGPAQWTVTSEEVFARYPAHDAGSVQLAPQNVVWSYPAYLAVWKLGPQKP